MKWRWAIPILGSLAMLAATAYDAAASEPLGQLGAPAPVAAVPAPSTASSSEAHGSPSAPPAARGTLTAGVGATADRVVGAPGAPAEPVAPVAAVVPIQPIKPVVDDAAPVVPHAVARVAEPLAGPVTDAADGVTAPVLASIVEPVREVVGPVTESISEPVLRRASGLIRALEPAVTPIRTVPAGARASDLGTAVAGPTTAPGGAPSVTLDLHLWSDGPAPDADPTTTTGPMRRSTGLMLAPGDGSAAARDAHEDVAVPTAAIAPSSLGAIGSSAAGSVLVGVLVGSVLPVVMAFRSLELRDATRRFGLAPAPLVPPG